MRYHEICGGLRVAASIFEQELLDSFDDFILDETLDEWEQELARKMVSKGLLNRVTEGDRIKYVKNKLEPMTRM